MRRFNIALLVSAITFAPLAAHAGSRDVQNSPKGTIPSFGPEGTAPSIFSNTRAVTTIDLAGFQAFDGGFPGALNSRQTIGLEPNAQVTSITFNNLQLDLSNGSFGSEFVISTNQSTNTGAPGTFWDYRPFAAQTSATPDPTPVINGAFTAPSNQFASGPFPLLADGQLLLYVYETFNDATTAVDATVISGTLTITTVVPEPTSLAALALGGLLLRRRRA